MTPEILAKVSAIEEARASAARAEAVRERILRAGLCPKCGSDVACGSPWIEVITGRERYCCLACGERFVITLQD